MASKENDTTYFEDIYNKMSLLDLNEDCLFHIFSFVGLYDLVNLAEIDEYFQEVSENIFKKQKNFKINFREIDVKKTVRLIQYIGPYLEALAMTVGYSIPNRIVQEILRPTVEFCRNLKRLTIHYLKTNQDHINLLKTIVPSLKYLDLSYCDLDDTAEELMILCKELNHLVLIGNYRFLGKGLGSIKTLKKLEVEFKTVFQNPIFSLLRRENPELQIEVYENGMMVRSVMEV